jgi:hypothetical protein
MGARCGQSGPQRIDRNDLVNAFDAVPATGAFSSALAQITDGGVVIEGKRQALLPCPTAHRQGLRNDAGRIATPHRRKGKRNGDVRNLCRMNDTQASRIREHDDWAQTRCRRMALEKIRLHKMRFQKIRP